MQVNQVAHKLNQCEMAETRTPDISSRTRRTVEKLLLLTVRALHRSHMRPLE